MSWSSECWSECWLLVYECVLVSACFLLAGERLYVGAAAVAEGSDVTLRPSRSVPQPHVTKRCLEANQRRLKGRLPQ